MLVYGDHPRRESPERLIQELRARLASLPEGGIERHAALAEGFIAAAELARGLADAEFAVYGADQPSPLQDAAMAPVMALARALLASWRAGFAAAEPELEAGLDVLAALPLPETIETKPGEGYAFYALYPEAYAEAAEASGLGPATTVVGIRSIGLGLAAIVAAALGAPAPITVRPGGHPFRRTLALSPALQKRFRQAAGGDFAVVDEGPGLSGSSFQAVAQALAQAGADPDRLVFFPSHASEPGPRGDPAWRKRWSAARRAVVEFDDLVPRNPDPRLRLEAWVADLIGAPVAPLQDISGGGWRGLAFEDEAAWPPASTHQERRKFIARTGRGAWLLKFAGLGPDGPAKLARARVLAQAGFSPAVAGLRHGFLVERWIEDSRPLDPAAFGRGRLVDHLGRYLGFRAARFPAGAGAGASLAALVDMARTNAREALGSEAEAALDRWRDLEALERRVRRVETDNRLHAWEWRVGPGGGLLKNDALDHAHAHDLVGPQDLAWDVAGAVCEFSLQPEEAAALIAAIGHPVEPALLDLLVPCYLAFQLGAFTMAAEAHGSWPEEQARLAGARDRYAERLERTLRGLEGSTGPARLA